MVRTEVVVAVQGKGSVGDIAVGDDETSVFGNHGTSLGSTGSDGPSGVVATCGEVGAAGIAKHVAAGGGEGVVGAIGSHRPIIEAIGVGDGVRESLGSLGDAGEEHAGGLARGLSSHGIVVVGVLIETGGEDDLGAVVQLREFGETDIVAGHLRLHDAAADRDVHRVGTL